MPHPLRVRDLYVAYLAARCGRNATPELYREERWITIGGRPEGEKKHAQGTPVRVDSEGQITAGPAALRGKKVSELNRPDNAPRKLRRSESLPGQQFLFAGAKAPQERRAKQGELPFHEPEERHPIPPTTRKLADGRIVGHAIVTVDELEVDPAKFQYKLEGIDPTTGTGAELKEVKQYRPEFGGQLLVWRDPTTGTNYVVNGHHRFELAKRSGYKGPIAVYFIDARNEREARAIGALANIAEGRGTAIDAARFMRESGMGPEELREHGVSLKGQIAREGALLRHLTPHLFTELTFERLTKDQAVTIATHLWDEPDLQEQLFTQMRKRGRFSLEELDEVARDMKSAVRTEKQATLFGEEENRRSLVWEKAAIKANIRRRLGEQVRAFATVSQERKADILQSAGNVIVREQNEKVKQKLEEAQYMFDIEANSRGQFSDMLNRYAEALADNPRRKRDILEDAWNEAAALLGLEIKRTEKPTAAPMLFNLG
jgi:hypothetical protein